MVQSFGGWFVSGSSSRALAEDDPLEPGDELLFVAGEDAEEELGHLLGADREAAS